MHVPTRPALFERPFVRATVVTQSLARNLTTMCANVNGRMDGVMYMQSALDRYVTLDRAEVGRITMEIAMLGHHGLEVNNPAALHAREH